jgi:hypothetical protein
VENWLLLHYRQREKLLGPLGWVRSLRSTLALLAEVLASRAFPERASPFQSNRVWEVTVILTLILQFLQIYMGG